MPSSVRSRAVDGSMGTGPWPGRRPWRRRPPGEPKSRGLRWVLADSGHDALDADYTELLPLGPDDTPYRLVTTEGVSTFETPAGTFLKVEPSAITRSPPRRCTTSPTSCAPDHLAQLRKVLDDPEASDNDRFVALDLLKNASIAAGGVLPMCQDTGTAIVKGKKGQFVFTGGGDEAAIAAGRAADLPHDATCATARWRR